MFGRLDKFDGLIFGVSIYEGQGGGGGGGVDGLYLAC